MFYDRARIWIKAGNGGDGSASFRREKFVPKGGPDGGDGGRGGSVYLRVNPAINTLLTFHFKQHFKAEHGGSGGGRQKHGKAGKDLYLEVPPGTFVEVIDENPISGAAAEAIQADMVRPDQSLMVARGGRGGLGNIHFATSTQQTPRFAEKGEPGEERMMLLELKIIADVGIVGYPNVGKSTLLSTVSAAQPKIADYPFTTLEPMLGVVNVGGEEGETFVMADIPGLIEGASSGAGLGLEFLRHVERTRLLLHIVDGAAGLWQTGEEAETVVAVVEDASSHPAHTTNPIADFKRINAELEQYDPDMATKPQIVAINKIDLQEVRDRLPALKESFKEMGYEALFPISAATGEGIKELIWAVAAKLRELPRPEWQEDAEAEEEAEVIVKPRYVASESNRFEVTQEEQGRYRVSGHKVERLVVMTDMGNPFALERLQKEFEKAGVTRALTQAGVQPGDTVSFGRVELEWSDESWVNFEKNISRRKKREGPGKQKS